jgi:hypothetical protein
MAIFDVLKTAAKVAQEAGKIELYGEILQVYEKLLDQQKRIADLETDNIELRKQLTVKGNLIFERNAYFLSKDEQKDGPFCTRCKDVSDKMVRMCPGNYIGGGWALCPECRNQAKA